MIRKFFAQHGMNILITIGLVGLIIALASNSSPPREAASDETREVPATTQSPTPKPLPRHFPTADEVPPLHTDPPDRSIEVAVETCWPHRNQTQALDDLREVPMSYMKLEALFGKIRRRENLTDTPPGGAKLEIDARQGLLFDTSVFSSGAAGSVTESDGEINDLRLRAEGRNLVCGRTSDGQSHLECECF